MKYNGGMISAEFAPNEQWDDALLSLTLMFQPWRWYRGKDTQEVRKMIGLLVKAESEDVHLFLSGRAGLFHLLKSLKLPPASEVVVTGFTCGAVVLPIIENKLNPVYNDVSWPDCSSDPEKTPPLIGKNTRVMLIQHTFGIPPRRRELIKIAQEHGLAVIEDLAHGFQKDIFLKDSAKTYKLLSFGRSKSMSSVFGGAVITHGGEVRGKMRAAERELRDVSPLELIKLINYKWLALVIKSTYSTLWLGKILHKVLTTSNILIPEITRQEKAGAYDPHFEKAYPNALAAMLRNQLKKYESTCKNRGEVVKIYQDALQGKLEDSLCLARYPVLVKDRGEVFRELKQYNVYPGKWYTQPVAPAGLKLAKVGYAGGSCPNAEYICGRVINLPTNIHPETAKDIAKIVKPHVLQWAHDS